MDWRAEIVDLHAVFEAWFRSGDADFDRFERVLDPSFTIISPSGVVADKNEIVDAVRSGGGRSPEQRIVTADHRVLVDDGDLVVARYVEHHRTPTAATRRWATVVFRRDDACPNGLRWLTVHETWAADGA